jgi:hypothetical protein
MTKAEVKSKMTCWIELKRRETDMLTQLMNEQYILGMLDLAQMMGVIDQNERMELLDMAEGQEEDEEEIQEESEDSEETPGRLPGNSQEIQLEEPELYDDDTPLTVEDGPDNYLVRAHIYKDHWITRFFSTLSEANQYRTDCLCAECDDAEIYARSEGYVYRLLFK